MICNIYYALDILRSFLVVFCVLFILCIDYGESYSTQLLLEDTWIRITEAILERKGFSSCSPSAFKPFSDGNATCRLDIVHGLSYPARPFDPCGGTVKLSEKFPFSRW
uniref:Uncharacterized protein n=1 Tax=Opuntia streptacantha TaxID=393608 RepID=A0A7C9EGP2_OPUST